MVAYIVLCCVKSLKMEKKKENKCLARGMPHFVCALVWDYDSHRDASGRDMLSSRMGRQGGVRSNGDRPPRPATAPAGEGKSPRTGSLAEGSM